jgi:hypothetical protein
MQFVPDRDPFRNCLTCSRLGEIDYGADVIVCTHRRQTTVYPGWRDGCASYCREPGTTDSVFAVIESDEAFRDAQRRYAGHPIIVRR